METPNQTQPPSTPTEPQPPVIPESELKLPEEGLNGAAPAPEAKFAINPLLIVLLVMLLAVLGAVIIWGEEIIEMVLPAEESEIPMPAEEETVAEDTAAEITELEAEIDQNEAELNALEQELNQMEAEIEAEMDAEATTTGSTGG